MKRPSGKFFASFLAVVTCLALSASAVAAAPGIYISGDYTEEESGVGDISGTWSNTEDTGLTLNDYHSDYGIECQGDLQITLHGENEIHGVIRTHVDGIYDENNQWVETEQGDLTITGDGSLKIDCDDSFDAISTGGDLNIDNTVVEIEYDNSRVIEEDDDKAFVVGFVVSARGDVNIKDSQFTITAEPKSLTESESEQAGDDSETIIPEKKEIISDTQGIVAQNIVIDNSDVAVEIKPEGYLMVARGNENAPEEGGNADGKIIIENATIQETNLEVIEIAAEKNTVSVLAPAGAEAVTPYDDNLKAPKATIRANDQSKVAGGRFVPKAKTNAEAPTKPSTIPQTADTSNAMGYAGLMSMAVAAFAMLLVARRRNAA